MKSVPIQVKAGGRANGYRHNDARGGGTLPPLSPDLQLPSSAHRPPWTALFSREVVRFGKFKLEPFPRYLGRVSTHQQSTKIVEQERRGQGKGRGGDGGFKVVVESPCWAENPTLLMGT